MDAQAIYNAIYDFESEHDRMRVKDFGTHYEIRAKRSLAQAIWRSQPLSERAQSDPSVTTVQGADAHD